MSRVLGLKLLPSEAIALVVRSGGERLVIERAARIPLPTGEGSARGKAIHSAIAAWKVGRPTAVVAVGRSELTLQNLDLPPMPADDLPDLVHLQAERDVQLSEDGHGFDFLTLAGDESHPYRVLGAGMAAPAWKQLLATIDGVDAKVSRVVPEPFGWVELGRRALGSRDAAPGVFAAIIQRQAVVWASHGDSLRLIRTVWLPADDNAAADAAALGNELRRTLLALAQSHDSRDANPRCYYLGDNADEIAGELGATISKPVQASSLEKLIDVSTEADIGAAGLTLVELAPLAALAAAAGEGRAAPLDLLHPRRRPPAPSRARTYALAAAAALAGLAMLAWQGYRNLHEPLEIAAAADAERKAMAPTLEAYAADEAKAAAIRAWVSQSVNLLTEMNNLSQRLRPEPLASEKFSADQDLVVTKIVLASRQITFDAAAKSTDAIPPAERRLREGSYRVERGAVELKAEETPGYGVRVTETIERVEPAAPPTEGTTP
jgi:hypothetical protein